MNQEHPHTKHHKAHGLHNRPYWKHAHHDWKFWVAILLMFFAIGIYLRSNDLSVRPQAQLQQRVP